MHSPPEPVTEPAPPASLWRHRNFLLLWTGQSVSEMGSAITQLALPLTVVVVLGASTFQVGLLAGRLGRRIGSARIVWYSMLVFGLPQLLIPLTAPGWRVAAFAVGMAASSFSAVVYNVAQVSYRQAICPPRLLGRMNAAIRWVVWGTIPLGALLGGVFGTLAGVRATLWIAYAGSWAAGWWVFFSPLRRQRDLEDTAAQKTA